MPSMRTQAGKALWRRTAAVALAACGAAAAQDSGGACAACPTPAAAPTDLSQLYRDAYLNPGAMAPPGGGGYQPGAVPSGEWVNPSRYRWFFGGDYIKFHRPSLQKTALTSVSNDLFWDDPLQQANGALNAAIGAADPATLSRAVGAGATTQLFPAKFAPTPGLQPELYTPNDPAVRINVNEFLVPEATRMSSDNFSVNRGLDGFRPKIGVVLPDGNSLEASYFKSADFQPTQLIDNVAGAGFLTRIISNGNDRIAPFAFFRWGYLRAPFTLAQGSRTPQEFANFRGEDVRGFGANNGVALGQTANFPHLPYNEVPAPEGLKGGGILTYPALFPVAAPAPFLRSTDIPRKPTTNDFPGLGSLIFRNGELAIANFRSDLQGGELLYRRNVLTEGETNWHVQLLGGARYINLNERFNYFWAQLWQFSRTTAAGPVGPLLGNTATPNIPQPPTNFPNDNGVLDPIDQRGQAAEETQVTLDRKISNNIFGPQIGIDARFPFWNYFDVQLMTKGGWMLNAASTSLLVQRGDGLIYTGYSASKLGPAGMIEGQFGLNFHPHEKVVFHAGWEYMWLMGTGTALGNLSGDLSQANRPGTNQQQFYTGWYLGGQINF